MSTNVGGYTWVLHSTSHEDYGIQEHRIPGGIYLSVKSVGLPKNVYNKMFEINSEIV